MNSAAKNYAHLNVLPKRDAKEILDEYQNIIEFNNLERVIDIASGDGGVTSVLRTYLPKSTQLIGADINEDMVTYANKHNGDERTKFMILDIVGELPNTLMVSFNLVHASYLLHWVHDHERAIKNMYNLLSPGGHCLAYYLGHHIVMDVIYDMARRPKYQPWANFAGFMIDHKDLTVDEKVQSTKNIMISVGFTNVKVEIKERPFDHGTLASWKDGFAGVKPYNFPDGLEEEYYKDCLDLLREMTLTPEDDVDEKHIVADIKLIVLYGKK